MKNSRYFDLPQALFTKITSYKSICLPQKAQGTHYTTRDMNRNTRTKGEKLSDGKMQISFTKLRIGRILRVRDVHAESFQIA